MLLALMLVTFGPAHAQESQATGVVRAYSSVGRIKWVFPKGFAYYFAVPHFTMGARIKCKGPGEECEIQVLSRDLRKSHRDRIRELIQKLKPEAKGSEEGEVRVQFRGTREKIIYATLTDPRPNQEYKFLTAGYAEKGPGLVMFQQLANHKADIQTLLDVIEYSKALDTRAVWAWRLRDDKAVCSKMYPAYSQANASAFTASAFASVNVPYALKPVFSPDDKSVDDIRAELRKSRRAFAEDFGRQDPATAQAFCRDFPGLVAKAAKDLPSK